jgi:hypothetical protein
MKLLTRVKRKNVVCRVRKLCLANAGCRRKHMRSEVDVVWRADGLLHFNKIKLGPVLGAVTPRPPRWAYAWPTVSAFYSSFKPSVRNALWHRALHYSRFVCTKEQSCAYTSVIELVTATARILSLKMSRTVTLCRTEVGLAVAQMFFVAHSDRCVP